MRFTRTFEMQGLFLMDQERPADMAVQGYEYVRAQVFARLFVRRLLP